MSTALESSLPVLYSLQNCPYAMRSRLAILLAQQQVQLRAITMKDKPAEMLLASPKATVPVLVIANSDVDGDDKVVDESLDIMMWELNCSDPEHLLYSHDPVVLPEMLKIIQGDDLEACRIECEPFVQALEQRLSQNEFFMGSTPSLLDFALLPFIRQFSKVNKTVFAEERYSNLRRWLSHHLQSRLFSRAMFKYPLWLDNREVCLFGE